MAASLLLSHGRGDQGPSQGEGSGSSPLQQFIQAKNEMIYSNSKVEGYVNETDRFLVSVGPEEVYAAAQEYGEKVDDTLDSRTFFGIMNTFELFLDVNPTFNISLLLGGGLISFNWKYKNSFNGIIL